jgi:hypothetical protein
MTHAKARLHNTDMLTQEQKLKLAYENFRVHHAIDCQEEFAISTDEWIDYFMTVGTSATRPRFKANRVRRKDTSLPWSIANLRCLSTAQYHEDQKANNRKRHAEDKAAGKARKPKGPKQEKPVKSVNTNARQADEDDTIYQTLTVAEWKSQLSQKAA